MMNPGPDGPSVNRLNLTISALIGLVTAAILRFKGIEYLDLAILGTSGLAVAILFVVNKRLLVFLVPLLVPFSIPIGLAGALASVPAEPLLALLTLTFFFWAFFEGKIDKNILLHPITILLALDLLWLTICTLTSTHIVYSLKRVIMRLFFVGGGYLMMSHFFKQRQR